MGTSTIMFDRLVPPGGEFKPRTRVRIRLVAADDGEGVGFNATDRRTILGLADQLLVASELFVIDLTAQDYIDAPENTVYEVQRVYPKSPAPPVETFSVPIEPAPTTTTSALTLPVTTIPVDSTESFTASGVVYLAGEIVEYAGKTSTTLTGCTGGAGPVASGEAVRQAHWIPDYLVNPPVGLPNLHVDDAIGAHAASAVAVAPTGGLVATDAQAALAELDSDLAAEAALARNADNLTSGTVADARIAASIARDSEVTAAVAAEAALRETGDTTRSANQQVANYTLVLSDAGKAVEGNAAGALNFTVPPNSSVAYPTGTIIEVVQVGAGAVSLVQGSGVTITGDTATPGQGGSLLLRKTGTNAWFSAIASVRSGTYVDTTTTQTVAGDKTLSGKVLITGINEGPLDPRTRGAVGDGVADDTAAIAQCLLDIPATAATGGALRLLNHVITSPLTFRHFMTFQGENRERSRLRATSGDLFNVTGTSYRYVSFEHCSLIADAGHVFNVAATGGIGRCTWLDVFMQVKNTIKSVMYMPAGGLFIDNLLASFDIQGVADHSVPLWYLRGSSGAINTSTFIKGRCTYSGDYVFWLEDTGGSYVTNMKFQDINFEITRGGNIKILSGKWNTIDNCGTYDLLGTTTKDLYYIGKGTASPESRLNKLINCNRTTGGSLGAGLADIKLEAASGGARNTIAECNGVIDLNNTSGNKLYSINYTDTIPASVINRGTAIEPDNIPTAIFDSFTRADGGLNASAADTAEVWTAGAELSILSNQLRSTTTAIRWGRVPDAIRGTNKRVQATVAVLPSTGVVGVVARAVDDNNAYYVQVGSTGVVDIVKRFAGTFTGLKTSAAGVCAAGDILAIIVDGSIISASVNGKRLLTVRDTSLTVGTMAGVLFSDTTGRLDDFLVSSA